MSESKLAGLSFTALDSIGSHVADINAVKAPTLPPPPAPPGHSSVMIQQIDTQCWYLWYYNVQIHSAATVSCLQGLGELGKHKSRLEKEKEAAAAARRATGASPPVSGKLPSYMRPTSASKAMQKVCVLCPGQV